MSRCEFTLYLWPQGFCILIPVHTWPIAILPEFFLPFSLATDCPVGKQVLYLPKFYPALRINHYSHAQILILLFLEATFLLGFQVSVFF